MRVIAGSAKSLQLKTVKGLHTRPTTDKIKETLFNMLQNKIQEGRFLDLYSGSGAIGIEALSRGAKEAVFVENNRQALYCIEENLKFTKLYKKAKIIAKDCLTALQLLNDNKENFSIIFMDPPYQKNYEKEVLGFLSQSFLIQEDTILIIESALETEFSYLDKLGFTIEKEKKYKTNKHIWIKRK